MNSYEPGDTGESPLSPKGAEVNPMPEADQIDVPTDISGSGLQIESCRTKRLGAEVLPHGVRFAVYSENARRIHVALFPPDASPGSEPSDVLLLPDCREHIFQGFVPGIGAGWQYGFHAEGPFDPRHGHRFNPRKFLIDPYARALTGEFQNPGGVLCGHITGAGLDADLTRDHRPSRPFMPRGLILDDDFDWQGVEAPSLGAEELVIYEVHLRGFTRSPSSGVSHPGTYIGLVEKIPYLKSLGINAVELLPVHAKYSEDLLIERGLSNYWGYNSASFFAVEPSYGTRSFPGSEVNEFKTMVRELHRAGILVILDVVYNHTAEGSERGPTLSLRGLDNKSYYSVTGPEDAPGRYYHNFTGCGNTVNFGSAPAIRLAMDSLRYFSREMRVDGFRFDLATVHGRREGHGFDPEAPFFTAVAQDPVLADRIMIAEPWDIAAHGTGRFPRGWMEWNDDFRDIIRRWVRGDSGLLPALREKLEGSPGQFAGARREPWTSVNFVTSHDGFTLRDLVTYGQKHNLANGEDNRDGSHENHGWNCGHEGPVNAQNEAGKAVEVLRARQARNLLMLTVLARGTPMLLGGDEFLRTQNGNNNAYCQDNETSWFNWNRTPTESGFLRFTREALAWRKLIGPPGAWGSPQDRVWDRCWQGFTPAGKTWTFDQIPTGRHAAFMLHASPSHGTWATTVNPGKEPLWYLLLNTEDAPLLFHLPPLPPGWEWLRIMDTARESPDDIATVGEGASLAQADRATAESRSMVLLRAVLTG